MNYDTIRHRWAEILLTSCKLPQHTIDLPSRPLAKP